MKAKQLIAGFCLLAGMGLAVYSDVLRGRAFAPAQDSVAKPGSQLPALGVIDDAGKPVNLNVAARGARSVIVFYSASCDTCRMVLRELQPFPPEIKLFLVKTGSDDSYPSPEFLQIDNATVLFDRNGIFRRSFLMRALPTILFVDKQGILRDGLVGAHGLGLVQKRLNEFKAGPPGEK